MEDFEFQNATDRAIVFSLHLWGSRGFHPGGLNEPT